MRRSHPIFAIFALAAAASGCEGAPFEDVYVRVAERGTWSRTARGLGADEPPILFMNRCAPNGCTVRQGPVDDSRFDISSIVTGTVTIPAFNHGDDVWEETVRCVQKRFEPFDITVTDVDPGMEPHFENYVGGLPRDAGFPPTIGGVASFACGVIDNAVSFTFARTTPEAEGLCIIVAHEAGHNFGLEHEMLCSDPMTYLMPCGDKEFQRVDVECGEHMARPCDCGEPYQNTFLSLMDSFGPRRAPIRVGPHVAIVVPDEHVLMVEPRFAIFIEAEDDVAVARVDVTIDGAPIGTGTIAPYVFRAPDGLSEGEHEIVAWAFDDEGLSDTATRTVNLEIPPPIIVTWPDSGPRVDAEPRPDASRDGGVEDSGGAENLDEGSCACSNAHEGRGGAEALAAWLVLAIFRVTTRKRAAAVFFAVLLAFLAGCNSDGGLSFVGATLELDPPPGTTLVFSEHVLGRSLPEAIIIDAKSTGTGNVVLDPRPRIEGRDAQHFFFSSAPRVLLPSQSGEIWVRFKPQTFGDLEAELVVFSNDRKNAEVRWPLRGHAREACALAMSPPHQRMEVSDRKTVTIRAASSHECSITRLNTDFTLFEFIDPPELPVLIPAGEELVLTVHHFARTTKPGIPIRHIEVRESEGTEAFVSIEGQPAAWDCIEAFPKTLEFPDSAMGIPVRQRIAVTNGCDTSVHVLAAYTTLGRHFFSVASPVPLAVPPFGTAGLWIQYEPFSEALDNGEVVLQTDDASVPEMTVLLEGKGIAPRAFTLRELDFGDVRFERPSPPDGLSACVSRRTVPVLSAGAADLLVRSLALDPEGDRGFAIRGASLAGAPVSIAAPIIVPRGEQLDVELELRPSRLAPAVHRNTLTIEHTAIVQPSLVDLEGQATMSTGVLDRFAVPLGPKVDVLFVIDDSLSMVGPSAELVRNASRFLDQAESRNADYRIGVISADSRSTNAAWLRRCTGPEQWVLESGWGDATMRRTDLECRLQVGTRGRALQSGLGAAMLALERAQEIPELGVVPNPNTHLLRDDASLAVIVASNDDDQSIEPPDLVRNYLALVKGRRDLISVHAIAGPVATPCIGGPPWVIPGERYAWIANETGGTFWDICESDLGPAIDGIAAAVFQPQSTFLLSQTPDEATLRVEVDGTVVNADPIDGYTYDALDNTVTLHGAAIPIPGGRVDISYNGGCEG